MFFLPKKKESGTLISFKYIDFYRQRNNSYKYEADQLQFANDSITVTMRWERERKEMNCQNVWFI